MRRIEWLKYITMMVIMMFMVTACSEGGSNDETPQSPSTPQKPDTPVNDGDWQVVPVTGGTIQKDDITIEFPSGTFKKDTKIAVKKVKKGEICGDCEVSEFYQITAPVTTYQTMTFKIKSENLSDGVSLVLHSLGYAPSTDDTSYTDVYMETTYKNGEYITTMPVLKNENDNDTFSYTIGLVKSPLANAGTRGAKDGTIVGEGMVGDVMWTLYIAPSARKVVGYDIVLNDKTHAAVSQHIEESIQKILDLGFKLREWNGRNRVVKFLYTNTSNYGLFRQSPADCTLSSIEIGVDKIKEEGSDPSQLKCTIIHELFHYFQAEYDPRVAYDKAGGYANLAIDNQSIINEMASVWVEQFMNDGKLNVSFLNQVLGNSFSQVNNGQVGFGQEVRRWGLKKVKDGILDQVNIVDDIKTTEYLNYQEQGYSMGPWLQYLLKEIKILKSNVDVHPVLKLYTIFLEKWKNKTYNSYYIIEEWLNSYDKALLNNAYIKDYYKELFDGQLINGFTFHNLSLSAMWLKNSETLKLEAQGRCFPYGCAVNKFILSDYNNISLTGKELVIKQEKPDVNTILCMSESTGNKRNYRWHSDNYGIATEVKKGDSLVLKGNLLEKYRNKDGKFNLEFFLVTMNSTNKMHDEKTENQTFLTIELRDTVPAKKPTATINPKELTFLAGGGTTSVTVDGAGFKHVGCDAPPSWLTVKVDESDRSISFTAEANMTSKERTDTVKCYVTNVDKPTNKDKTYLSVTVTQKAFPSVSPTSLTFEAEGGMQTLKCNYEGYKYSACLIDEADTSWLSRTFVDGTYEVTAEPNMTGKERSTTIRCYFANVKNSAESERIYVDVKVAQKANEAPTVSPASLAYEAEGGMQTLQIKVQGWKYCGCIIDDEAKSWLSKNYVGGGLYEVTAEPNTTSQVRTTTIRCYVANEKDAPDDKRIYMEVQVAQMAGKEQTAFDKYQFAYGYVEMNIDTNIDGRNTMGRIDFEASDKFLTVSSNGKGLHFDINYKVNEKDYNETIQCQFDIDDFSLLESKKSKVTNLSWKVDTNNKGGRSWAGVWAAGGDGWLVSQTQKIRFSTNSKIPEMDFEWGDDGTRSVNWYAYSNDISPTECTYDRSSTTISEEVGVIIDKGKGMQDGSNIWISLHFKEVAN